ncbi:hypothetical protein TRICI_004761 [Trichomonascus ciferrii]|uniref:Peptidyl-prolyl cis-trans isomerase n=1 Tax=Trichomonascus ciferrii TaxID=44093 RepID=A0A642UZF7_9ASCO|nr:hypothetical protein TRICI_004761 [Trichomonascus ciferrii]
MATVGEEGERFAASQFVVTLSEGLEEGLDEKLAVFGQVVEGHDTLDKINNAYCDQEGRPLKDIRIKHTYILEDPFEDPNGFVEPESSPDPTDEQLASVRIGEDEDINTQDDAGAEKRRMEQEARSQALTLEMVGDLPFAEVKPQENVLFVCKLNPITQDEDLELIFSRFGKILSCEIIRDKATGDSLQYAFIEFERKENCERAYFKMEGVLIDDSRIHVDFSQSVARLQKTRNSNNRTAHHTSRDRDRDYNRSRHDDRDRDYNHNRDRDRRDNDRDREKSDRDRDRRDRDRRDRHRDRHDRDRDRRHRNRDRDHRRREDRSDYKRRHRDDLKYRDRDDDYRSSSHRRHRSRSC